jgi:hypothetical protein
MLAVMVTAPSPLQDPYLADRLESPPGWAVVVRHEAHVLDRLRRGECDGLLPDDWLAPDDLLHFALDGGALDVFATLPDHRQRRSIPAPLLGKVLLAGTLPDRRSLSQIGVTVFQSAVILDQLGFNFYYTREGGPRTGDARPFDVEALGDFLAALAPTDYTTHATTLAAWLRSQPELTGTTWALDCVDVRLPKGRVPQGQTAETLHLKVAVLSVLTPDGALPLLWRFGTPQDGDITLARPLWDDAVRLWGAGACRTLLVDAGFLDGPWLAQVHGQGTTVLTRLRDTMDPLVAARAYVAAHPALPWETVPAPKRPAGHERPVRREIVGLTDWPGWDAFGQDLALCLVCDTYADGHTDLWGLMSTDPGMAAPTLYATFAQRWQLEETFMALARYHLCNALPASRIGVACARVHALLFAYTVRVLCQARQREQQAATAGRPWRRRTTDLILYAGGEFGIFKPSVVLEVILTHADVWRARQAEILAAVRYCEGSG